jgi:hypothetical protein
MGGQPPFGASRAARDELRRRISEALPTKTLATETEATNPGFKVSELVDPSSFHGFIEAIEWGFQEARNAQRKGEDRAATGCPAMGQPVVVAASR